LSYGPLSKTKDHIGSICPQQLRQRSSTGVEFSIILNVY